MMKGTEVGKQGTFWALKAGHDGWNVCNMGLSVLVSITMPVPL